MNNSITYSLIIPALNEASNLTTNYPELLSFLSTLDATCEVILVDDGSTDNTCDILAIPNDLGTLKVIQNKTNQGKGFSIKRGLEASSGDIALITDADFSTSLNQFHPLIEQVKKGHDIVIGSRALKSSKIIEKQGIIRRFLGAQFKRWVRWMIMNNFSDTQCGFKVCKVKSVQPIMKFSTIRGWCFDVEFLLIAKRNDLSITEVAVNWKNQHESRLRLFPDMFKMGIEMIKIKIKDILNHYS